MAANGHQSSIIPTMFISISMPMLVRFKHFQIGEEDKSKVGHQLSEPGYSEWMHFINNEPNMP
jgi:hypothetical protein